MTTLTLDQASMIIGSALAHGRRAGFKPLCIVVLDAGGHMLALKREERASFSRPQVATAKAAGCLGMGFGGREIARRALATPAFYDALASILPQDLVPVAGGVLIRDAAGLVADIGAAAP
jgi:uncharacterized protein GlcG (DUF336 family)